MSVLILRPLELLEETLKLFRENGIEAYGCEFVKIRYLDFEIPEHDFLIVTSQNAAKAIVSKSLKLKKVIAIGKKTAEILKGYDVTFPKKFESSAIVEEFKEILKGKKVVAVRSKAGGDELRKISEFAEYKEIFAYETVKLKGEKQKREIEKVKKGFYDAIVFSSKLIAEAFFDLCDEDCGEPLKNVKLIAIGPPTASYLRSKGFNPIYPDEYTFEGILKLIKSDAGCRC